jgi:hypothetical protein
MAKKQKESRWPVKSGLLSRFIDDKPEAYTIPIQLELDHELPGSPVRIVHMIGHSLAPDGDGYTLTFEYRGETEEWKCSVKLGRIVPVGG